MGRISPCVDCIERKTAAFECYSAIVEDHVNGAGLNLEQEAPGADLQVMSATLVR